MIRNKDLVLNLAFNCLFFIESKFFQLILEEGGRYYRLQIFERGKFFMRSVFMGKHAAQWLMANLEHLVVGVNPKQFFTLREGDTAYTLQRSSNSSGQFLLLTELKAGGSRRSVFLPVGKERNGWRTFGLELRKVLNPSLYAVGGLDLPKFIPQQRLTWSFITLGLMLKLYKALMSIEGSQNN